MLIMEEICLFVLFHLTFINEEATCFINEEAIRAITKAVIGLFHVLLFQWHHQLIDLIFLVTL